MTDLATVVWRQLLHAIGPPQRETEYLVKNIRCSKSLDAQSESENPTVKSSSSVEADTDINRTQSDLTKYRHASQCTYNGLVMKREMTVVGNEMSGLVQVITYRRHTTRRIKGSLLVSTVE